MTLVVALAVATTVIAAIRGTWSPCGASMLSTITPFAERSRGHRYAMTTAWFVLGATIGGACLGAVAAGLARLVAWGAVSSNVGYATAAGAALLTIVSDLRLTPLSLPTRPRQVDENWVNRFRPWVYGTGFGWQIGSGFTTYVMTAATYLMVVLSALTARPMVALLLGILFGSIRGLSLLAGSRQNSPAAMRRFHARFEAMRSSSWQLAVAVQLVVLATFAVTATPAITLALAAAGAVAACRWFQLRRPGRRHGGTADLFTEVTA